MNPEQIATHMLEDEDFDMFFPGIKLSDTYYDKWSNALEDYINAHIRYEETDQEAGDYHADALEWTDYDEDRLEKWLDEESDKVDTMGLPAHDIAELIRDNSSMKSDRTGGYGPYTEGFIYGWSRVGEVSIPLGTFFADLNAPPHLLELFWERLKEDDMFDWVGSQSEKFDVDNTIEYDSPDYWHGHISPEKLQGLIDGKAKKPAVAESETSFYDVKYVLLYKLDSWKEAVDQAKEANDERFDKWLEDRKWTASKVGEFTPNRTPLSAKISNETVRLLTNEVTEYFQSKDYSKFNVNEVYEMIRRLLGDVVQEHLNGRVDAALKREDVAGKLTHFGEALTKEDVKTFLQTDLSGIWAKAISAGQAEHKKRFEEYWRTGVRGDYEYDEEGHVSTVEGLIYVIRRVMNMDGHVMTDGEEDQARSTISSELYRIVSNYAAVLANKREHDTTTLTHFAESSNDPDKLVQEEGFGSYLETALWSSNDEEATPDYNTDHKTIYDFDPADLKAMYAEFRDFMRRAESLDYDVWVAAQGSEPDYDATLEHRMEWDEKDVAHNFWLNRNGHGAGFWDGDYPVTGDALSELCHEYGELNIYVGDDGKVYAESIDKKWSSPSARLTHFEESQIHL